MQAVFILGLALAALVSTASAGCACDDDFSGFGTEPGKCGCCPWPCCCKCFESEECGTTTTIDCPCLDLTFIVDASGSIGGADWALTLDFLVGIVNAVNAQLDAETCGDQINVAVVTFGNNATLSLPLTPSNDAVGMIPNIVQVRKLTNIVEGMEMAINEVYSDPSDCVPFAIILTDGRSNFRKAEIGDMGEQMRNAVDQNLLCIGITSQIAVDQLDLICPDPAMQMSVLGFDDLVDMLIDVVGTAIVDAGMGGGSASCVVSEECFCCCSPEQFWGAGPGYYGR